MINVLTISYIGEPDHQFFGPLYNDFWLNFSMVYLTIFQDSYRSQTKNDKIEARYYF